MRPTKMSERIRDELVRRSVGRYEDEWGGTEPDEDALIEIVTDECDRYVWYPAQAYALMLAYGVLWESYAGGVDEDSCAEARLAHEVYELAAERVGIGRG